MNIRPLRDGDEEAVWEIWQEVIQAGDAFTSDGSRTRDQVVPMWIKEGSSWVAIVDGEIAGVYRLIRPENGRCEHICGASYMVSRKIRRRGVGHALGLHSLKQAQAEGFLAMQFNCVVSSNHAAVALWKKLGFSICGTIPKGFRHAELGMVDFYIMHRFLNAEEMVESGN